MLKYADIICPERILTIRESITKDKLLAAMSALFADCDGVTDPAAVLPDIRAREEIMSTGIGGGIAIPHIRRQYINGVNTALAVLRQPLDYGAMDNKPVDIVIMILAGEDKHHDHLRTVAKFAAFLKIPQNRNQLSATENAAEIFRLLQESER